MLNGADGHHASGDRVRWHDEQLGVRLPRGTRPNWLQRIRRAHRGISGHKSRSNRRKVPGSPRSGADQVEAPEQPVFEVEGPVIGAGQLAWQALGCEQAAECRVAAERIANTWPIERVLEWTTADAA